MHCSKSIHAALLTAAVGLTAAAEEKQPLNILIVLSDDHSAPFLGCYGYPVKTPNLDLFAKRATRFTRFFTNAPQCVPSRASLMTGQVPSAVRMARFSSPLPPDIPTLPGELRKGGYYNGVCGRIYHLDGSGGSWRPDDASDKVIKAHHLKHFRDHFDFVDVSTGFDNTPDLFRQFLDGAPAGRPFFLWINFQDPHYPWPENSFSGSNRPEDMIVPGYLPDLPSVRNALAAHCDEITHLDHEFGLIHKILEERGFSKNTVIVFLGDNGMAFPHGKGSLYEPGLNVPFLIHWPGVTESAAVCDAICAGEDLMPTLLDIAGLKKPDHLRSVSFAPALRGKPFQQRQYMFGERGTQGIAPYTTMRPMKTTTTFDYARSVRSDRWKLICNYTPNSIYAPVDSYKLPYWNDMRMLQQDGALPLKLETTYFSLPRPIWELYDLEKDPDELNNVYGRAGMEAVTEELKSALIESMILNYDFLPLALPENSPAPVSGH